jgi:DNA-binding winged helix-turn-helix (wHTH) protein
VTGIASAAARNAALRDSRLECAAFGVFDLYPARKLLLNRGQPVRIGSRALDLLTFLVARAGCVVSNEVLMRCAWPTTVVVEQNLRVQISALRRALGESPSSRRWIANIPGRGYCFVGAIRWHSGPEEVYPLHARAAPSSDRGSRRDF